MSNYLFVFIDSPKDALLPATQAETVSKIVKQVVSTCRLSRASQFLVCTGLQLECIHLGDKIAQKLGTKSLRSQHLSLQASQKAVCNQSCLSQFKNTLNDSIQGLRNTQGIPPEKGLQIFLNISEFYEFLVIVLDMNFYQNFEIECQTNKGRFKILASQIADSEPQTPKKLDELQQIDKLLKLSEGVLSNHSENLINSLDLLSLGIQQAYSDIERLLSNENSGSNQIRGFQQLVFQTQQIQQKIREIESKNDDLVQKIDRNLPKFASCPVNPIEFYQFYYSNNKNGWVIKVYNNSDFSVYDISVHIMENRKEIIQFKLVQPKTYVKKVVKMGYDPGIYFKHLVAKHKDVPISTSTIINPVAVLEAQLLDDNVVKLFLKNQSQIQFQNLAIFSTNWDKPIYQGINLPPQSEKLKIKRKFDPKVISNAFLYIASSDNNRIVSEILPLPVDDQE